jgi:hypothetical protein
MYGRKFVTPSPTTVLCGWIDRLTPQLIRLAACNTPVDLSDRMTEEWLAASLEQ